MPWSFAIYEYVVLLSGKRDFADMITVKVLEMGRLLSQIIQVGAI